MSLEAKKEGYLDSQLIGENLDVFYAKDEKSRHLRLIAESDVSRVKLDLLLDFAFGPAKPNQPQTAVGRYLRLVHSLKESMDIATTSKEQQWVREQYCGRLQAVWAELDSDEQQRQFAIERHPDDFAEHCQ